MGEGGKEVNPSGKNYRYFALTKSLVIKEIRKVGSQLED